jgi:hypothetical protein
MNRLLIGAVIAALAAFAANAGEAGTFTDLDTNKDGKLSSAEVASEATLTANFRSADSDGDGALSQSEYDTWRASEAAMPASKPAEQPQPTTTPNQ